MVDQEKLAKFYKQELETKIIGYLSEKLGIDLRKAMDLYYTSKLSTQIEQGLYGIENLDYKNLAEDLIENEINKSDKIQK
ncbi:hypothetical protein J6Y50_08775 [bacterium]|nr:hypothetical protein [bacterium]